MATEHPDGNKPTLPIFTDSDHRFFDNFMAYAHENKCGWLIDKMDIATLEDMDSEEYKNAYDAEHDDHDQEYANKWRDDSSRTSGMLHRAVKYHPLARNIIKRALKVNPTDGVKALEALYKEYSPEARSAEISIMFNSYAQRGAPIQEFIATFDDYITALEDSKVANITDKYKVTAKTPALKQHVLALQPAGGGG